MDADEVTWITDEIAITNFFSAHQSGILVEQKIDAILCLDEEVRGDAPEARGVKCIEVVHLVDGPNDLAVFQRAVSALAELRGQYQRVVVHCRAGRSRSIAVVAAYLKQDRGMDAADALDFVKSKRASALAPELARLVERV
jgi:atypical dual specificity phosphatase